MVQRVPARATPTDPVPSPFPWGLIGGDSAAPTDPTKPTAAQITHEMEHKYHMVFNGTVAPGGIDVAMDTHGMIQAIYLVYGHGPSCRALRDCGGSPDDQDGVVCPMLLVHERQWVFSELDSPRAR